MAKKNRNILKSYFENGDIPTEGQYADLIDSFAILSSENTGSLNLKGNITATQFIGDGRYLTGITSSQVITTTSNLSYSSGSLLISGNLYYSSGSTNVLLGIRTTGSIVPGGNDMWDLGSPIQYFRSAYTNDIYAVNVKTTNINVTNDITASGDISASGTINANQFTGIFNGALSSSAQIATDISGAFTSTSASIAANVASNLVSINTNTSNISTLNSSGLLSSSFQIATEISGAFTSTSASIAADVASNLSSINTNTAAISTLNSSGLLSSSAQISADISGAFTVSSASISTRLTTAESELSNTLLSSSAQIATNISGAFTSTSASIAADVASNLVSLTTNASNILTLNSSGLLSGSAQIATNISGAFTLSSASISTRLTTAESELSNTLISSSAQIATEISGAFTSTSASIASDILNNTTNSFNTKGQRNGSSGITGSLHLTGSTSDLRVDGTVGIGTASPTATNVMMHIKSHFTSADPTVIIEAGSGGDNASIQLKNADVNWNLQNQGGGYSDSFLIRDTSTTNYPFAIDPSAAGNATHPLLYLESNKVSILGHINANPDANLLVSGNLFISGPKGHITASGDISASGDITSYSGSFDYLKVTTGSISHLLGGSPITLNSIAQFATDVNLGKNEAGGDAKLLNAKDVPVIDPLVQGTTSSGVQPSGRTQFGGNHEVELYSLGATKIYSRLGSTGAARIGSYMLIGSGSLPGGNAVANTDTDTIRFGSGSSGLIANFYDGTDTIIFNTAQGHITASGNISASGNIIAITASIQHLDGPEQGGISFSSGNPTLIATDGAKIEATDSVTISGGNNELIVGTIRNVNTTHVTASGNISSSGNFDLTGNANVDGNLDVDGTTNLDVVDIDGAVDMASTLVVASHITSSGNISASGTIIASNLSGTNTGDQSLVHLATTGSNVIFGNVTSSGNISSSGTIIANKIESDQLISRVGDANTGIQLASDTVIIEGNDVVLGTFATNRIELNLPITASGNISGSSTTLITAQDLTLDRRITAVSGAFQHITASVLDVDASTIRIGGSSFAKTDLDALRAGQSIPQTARAGFTNRLQPEAIFGKHDGDYIKFNVGTRLGTFLSASLVHDLNFTGSNNYFAVGLNNNTQLRLTGQITASSHISASGTLTVNKGVFGIDNIELPRVIINSTGHITASANISASGNIIAAAGIFGTGTTTINDNISSSGTLSSSGIFVAGNISAISMSGNGSGLTGVTATLPAGVISSSLQAFTNITASGNISASGTIVASNFSGTTSGTNTGDQNIVNLAVTGSNVIFGNITSSNNISASGTVTAAAGTFGTGTTTINDNINTTGDITASGNIKAGGNISASGNILGDTIIANNIVFYSGSTSIKIEAPDEVSNTAGSHLTLEAGDAFGPGFDGGNLILNAGAGSGPAMGGNITLSTFGRQGGGTAASGSFVLNSKHFNVSFSGSITSSGNISASGKLTAASLNTGQGDYELYNMNQNVTTTSVVEFNALHTNNLLSTSGSTVLGNTAADTHDITGNITSSGNISSSGTITAAALSVATFTPTTLNTGDITGSNITASGTIKADKVRAGGYAGSSVFDIAAGAGGIDTDGQMSCTGFANSSTSTLGGRLTLTGASSYVQTPSYVSASEFRTTGHITASGNISASGTVVGSNLSGINTGDQSLVHLAVTGSNVIFGNITSSGNISGSNTSTITVGGSLTAGAGTLTSLGVGTINSTSHITASGNISSSGIITANSLSLPNIVSAAATDAAFYIVNGSRGEIRSQVQTSIAVDTGWTLELRNTSVKANSLIVANVIGGEGAIITGSVLTANVVAANTASFNFFNIGAEIGNNSPFTASFAIF